MGIGGILGGMIESFTKNVFCDIVKPSIGSIVQVQLAAGVFPTESLCHTGIYVGNDKIIELTQNESKQAEIRVVSAEHFIEGDDLFPRTGTFIYVACGKNANGSCFALGNHDIARNAAQHIGKIWNGKYDLTENNCHMFCQCCILDGEPLGFELSDIENALKDIFEVDEIYWRSTGESRGSNPCFVDDDPKTTVEKTQRRFTYSMVEAYENGTAKGSVNSRKKKSQPKNNNKKYNDDNFFIQLAKKNEKIWKNIAKEISEDSDLFEFAKEAASGVDSINLESLCSGYKLFHANYQQEKLAHTGVDSLDAEINPESIDLSTYVSSDVTIDDLKKMKTMRDFLEVVLFRMTTALYSAFLNYKEEIQGLKKTTRDLVINDEIDASNVNITINAEQNDFWE